MSNVRCNGCARHSETIISRLCSYLLAARFRACHVRSWLGWLDRGQRARSAKELSSVPCSSGQHHSHFVLRLYPWVHGCRFFGIFARRFSGLVGLVCVTIPENHSHSCALSTHKRVPTPSDSFVVFLGRNFSFCLGTYLFSHQIHITFLST